MVGFFGILLLVFLDPAHGVAAVTESVQSAVFLVVGPIIGLSIGVYTYVNGAYAGGLVFLAGSYLGVFGLTLTIGFGLMPGRFGILTAVGAGLVALSVVALLVSLKRLTTFLQLAELLS